MTRTITLRVVLIAAVAFVVLLAIGTVSDIQLLEEMFAERE